MNRRITALFVALLFPTLIMAQEVLLDLNDNVAIKQYLNQQESTITKNKKALRAEPLSLPFVETFRQEGVYPDQEQFIDSNVFVSNTWAILPPDRGVATFDALDKFGNVYEHASSSPFIADYLTSRKINTTEDGSGNPIDNMTFYFHYQPQGRGIAPEENDSLVLQFLADSTIIGGTNDSVWINVWSSAGLTYEEFKATLGDFGRVQIDLSNVDGAINEKKVFFHENFRFRFYNYASLADPTNPTFRSNVDQWHVDAIYLNALTPGTPFALEEFSFSEAPASFLSKGYQSVPYRQYKRNINAFRKPIFDNYVSNLSNSAKIGKYKYTVRVAGETDIYDEYNGGSTNLPVYDPFDSYPEPRPFGTPPTNSKGLAPFPANLPGDTASFIIEHTLEEDALAPTVTPDVVRFHQKLYDYYAWDKGTPEKGYALQGLGTAAAVQFQVVEADSIRGVYMYFNRVAGGANEEQFFDLKIWRDNGFGKLPSDKIEDEIELANDLNPKWEEDDIYKFVRYDFENPVYLIPGLYYIGWVKSSTGALNVGFDTYIDNKDRNFVRVNNIWGKSNFEGSIMIRPIVSMNPVVGIQEPHQALAQTEIYPNPVAHKLNIRLSDPVQMRSHQVDIRISNLMGQAVIRTPYQEVIDVSSLEKGMYIITFIDNGNNTSCSKKLMVTE